MSRWLQSIGNVLEKLDDGASQAIRETLAPSTNTTAISNQYYESSDNEEDEDEYYDEDDLEEGEEMDDEDEEEVNDADAAINKETVVVNARDDMPVQMEQDEPQNVIVQETEAAKEPGQETSNAAANHAAAKTEKLPPFTTALTSAEEPALQTHHLVEPTVERASQDAIDAPATAETMSTAKESNLVKETGAAAAFAHAAPVTLTMPDEASAATKASSLSSPNTFNEDSSKFSSISSSVGSVIDKDSSQQKQADAEHARLQQTIHALEQRYRTDVSKLTDQMARMEQQHKQQVQTMKQKHSQSSQQHAQQQDALSKQVESLQSQLNHANNELTAQQRELDQAAHDIQQERQAWKEEKQELMEEQEQDRLEWQAQLSETQRGQSDQHQQHIQTLQMQLQEATRQSKAQQIEANKRLQASVAREEALQTQVGELQTQQYALEQQLAQATQANTQLDSSLSALSSSLSQAQERERAAEQKLDVALEQHQRQTTQRMARQVELEQNVQELSEALSKQQHSISQQQPYNVNDATTTTSSGGQETGEVSWKQKYETVANELDTLQSQFQLSQQQCQAIQNELNDMSKEREMELAHATNRQRQQDAVLEDMTGKLHRLESTLRERQQNHTGAASTAAADYNPIATGANGHALQRAIRDAEHAKQQMAALSDQLMRQQGTVDSYKAENLALKGRLQAANARADAAEIQMSSEMESANEGPYGPTPSKNRRRVKGGRYGRGFSSRSMRATLGMRAAPVGSIQEQIGGTVDAFDKWLLDTGEILRSEPVARVAFTAYIAVLHVWCFALVAFHTVQSEHADIGVLTNRAAPLHHT
ncbi:hypothetical protein MPSEU_001057100 [Mayamaea pseudoterrestris]|nr:hypothetical protein MPSEU_001057100 [Mayamaea pseudoterrestris]